MPERGYAPACVELAGPEVTVVIATRNRAARLATALRSLAAQTLAGDRFEVIVVDDGSDDDTAAVLTAEERRGELALRSLAHEGGGGPGAVRNSGWPHARGALVAFTDDDCEADPDWLEALLGAWGGEPLRLVQGATSPIPAELAEQGPLTYTYDIRELDVNFPCCNIAYPKALLERLGGFDAATFPHTGEDCDLAWRAIGLGAEPRFAPAARVRHAVVRLDHAGMLRRAWRWGGVAPAFARHPELRRRRLIYRVFYNWSHWYLARLVAAIVLPRQRALWPVKLWLARRYVMDRRWSAGAAQPSIRALGWNLVVDVVETTAMARGSVRNRTLVL
jgi:glycosyltransferase involved in cell wall biosynthesis